MSAANRARVKVGKNVHARRFDGELVILDMERGEYFGLDELGAQAWESMTAGRTVEEIAGALVAHYEVDRLTLERDLQTLADELLARGLLVTAGEEA